MALLNAIIIEPDDQSLQLLVNKLRKRNNINIIGTFTNLSDKIIDFIDDDLDIIFLDYYLSDKYKIDFIVHLIKQYPSLQIILMKFNARHLEKNIISEIQFLSKPITQHALDKVFEEIQKNQIKIKL